MDYRKHARIMRQIVSLPVIWSLIIPIVILDIFWEIYHNICFRLYDLPLVKRSKYIKIDRHKLQYLTWYEKIGCAYCGYTNGVLHYTSVIAAKTEEYWCGIKHKNDKGFIQPDYHKKFIEYGDRTGFEKKYGQPPFKR